MLTRLALLSLCAVFACNAAQDESRHATLYSARVIVGVYSTQDLARVTSDTNIVKELRALIPVAREMIGASPEGFATTVPKVIIDSGTDSLSALFEVHSTDPIVAFTFANTWGAVIVAHLKDKRHTNAYIKAPAQIPTRPITPRRLEELLQNSK
jgi:hypothetical protein